MDQQFEDFKKEYIRTSTPAKSWEEIAPKLGPQSHISRGTAVKSTLVISSLLILASAFLYVSPKETPTNQESAVVDNAQEATPAEEATPSASITPNLNLEQVQQAPSPKPEEKKQQDEFDQNEKKKDNFWDFFRNFYNQDSRNNGDTQGVKTDSEDDKDNHLNLDFRQRNRSNDR